MRPKGLDKSSPYNCFLLMVVWCQKTRAGGTFGCCLPRFVKGLGEGLGRHVGAGLPRPYVPLSPEISLYIRLHHLFRGLVDGGGDNLDALALK